MSCAFVDVLSMLGKHLVATSRSKLKRTSHGFIRNPVAQGIETRSFHSRAAVGRILEATLCARDLE